MTIINHLNSLTGRMRSKLGLSPIISLSQGLHPYFYKNQSEQSRIHLRVDPDGSAILMINANRIVHLNSTAAFMAYLALEQTDQEQATQSITHHFKVNRQEALSDFTQFLETFHELIRPDGACPIHELDLEVHAPFSIKTSAPYRMDLAVTYRCNNDCAHCYNARPRQYPELSTDEWKLVIDRLWQIGIPHIVFTGGEPTLRIDLLDLIAHAQNNGQITGLNTNGRRLSDSGYLQQLVQAAFQTRM